MYERDIQFFVPVIEKHLDVVVETASTREDVRVSRRLVIESYLETRNMKETARRLGLSRSSVRYVLVRAMYRARQIEGISAWAFDRREFASDRVH